MDYKKNIFCLEGDWQKDLRKKSSILSAIQLLETNLEIDTIYKTCCTKKEFNHRVHQLCKAPVRYKNYSIFYFAFHGENGLIDLGDDQLTLEEIAIEFQGLFKNKIVHFGSCKTVFNKKNSKQFLDVSGANAVSGFSKNIDFITSTAFDVIYFEACQRYVQMSSLKNSIFKSHPGFCEDLGFKMIHS